MLLKTSPLGAARPMRTRLLYLPSSFASGQLRMCGQVPPKHGEATGGRLGVCWVSADPPGPSGDLAFAPLARYPTWAMKQRTVRDPEHMGWGPASGHPGTHSSLCVRPWGPFQGF